MKIFAVYVFAGNCVGEKHEILSVHTSMELAKNAQDIYAKQNISTMTSEVLMDVPWNISKVSSSK